MITVVRERTSSNAFWRCSHFSTDDNILERQRWTRNLGSGLWALPFFLFFSSLFFWFLFSSFIVYCLLFTVYCLLFTVNCLLFIAKWFRLTVGGCGWLLVLGSWLVVVVSGCGESSCCCSSSSGGGRWHSGELAGERWTVSGERWGGEAVSGKGGEREAVVSATFFQRSSHFSRCSQ